jgi:FkbM family methyltransferase
MARHPRPSLRARAAALLRNEEFRRHPVRALWRRAFWRLRWLVTQKPWPLRLRNGIALTSPRLGSAALIYYQGFSEPETAGLLLRLLRPGMTFVDAGAHIGEYTLLAASAVGPTGHVHAFEPDPRVHDFLVRNVASSGAANVTIVHAALSDEDGERTFRLYEEPALSSLASSGPPISAHRVATVRSLRLDTYWSGRGGALDLVKVDVEGAEALVLRGAPQVMAGPHAPVWVFECHGENFARFGYSPADLLQEFDRHGYHVFRYLGDGLVEPVPNLGANPIIANLVAARDADALVRALASR